jgi:hypothetical protein
VSIRCPHCYAPQTSDAYEAHALACKKPKPIDIDAAAKAAYYASRPWARLAWEKQCEAERETARAVARAVLRAAGVTGVEGE